MNPAPTVPSYSLQPSNYSPPYLHRPSQSYHNRITQQSAFPSSNFASRTQQVVSNTTLASNPEEAVKSQFQTREGIYKLMTLSEFSRQSLHVHHSPCGAMGMASNYVTGTVGGPVIGGVTCGGTMSGVNAPCNASVRVSFVTLPADPDDESSNNLEAQRDFICFNIAREIYVYPYGGVSSATDLSRPIDKRGFKGTFPTCHDFNQGAATFDACPLLVGFSAGQIQLFDPFRKDINSFKTFNEDRTIDKTRVTCLKWIPGAPTQFLVSHASGCMYVYNEELPVQSSLSPPVYQQFKQGDNFAVYTCKAKSSRNPVYKWTLGAQDVNGGLISLSLSINEFEFSPDGHLLATVGQDGFLRIFNYHAMECVGLTRSYFGGLCCVAWSPDARYVAMGGEDDLITVYSVLEKRVVCRGQGHKSWISQVAFDSYTASTSIEQNTDQILDSEEDLRSLNLSSADVSASNTRLSSSLANSTSSGVCFRRRRLQKESVNSVGSVAALSSATTYRLGSVGHDTLLCFWDLTEDLLKPVLQGRIRNSISIQCSPSILGTGYYNNLGGSVETTSSNKSSSKSDDPSVSSTTSGKNKDFSQRLKRHFMGFKIGAAQTTTVNGTDKNRLNNIMPKDANKNSYVQAITVSPATPTSSTQTMLTRSLPQNLLGTTVCPLLKDVPLIEPLVVKKIAHERLTVLAFRQDCLVTACQEGLVSTWARPGKASCLRIGDAELMPDSSKCYD